jgi:hypothetical protein
LQEDSVIKGYRNTIELSDGGHVAIHARPGYLSVRHLRSAGGDSRFFTCSPGQDSAISLRANNEGEPQQTKVALEVLPARGSFALNVNSDDLKQNGVTLVNSLERAVSVAARPVGLPGVSMSAGARLKHMGLGVVLSAAFLFLYPWEQHQSKSVVNAGQAMPEEPLLINDSIPDDVWMPK